MAMWNIYKANPQFVWFLKQNKKIPSPSDPTCNATNHRSKILNGIVYCTQTNLDLTVCLSENCFRPWKLDPQMFVSMKAETKGLGYLMCLLLTEGNRDSHLTSNIKLKENLITNI